MSKLPVSWESISFVEGFDLEGGTQPPKSTFRTRPTPGYLRMYQIQDLNGAESPVYISEDGPVRRCQVGDILIGRYGASVGRVFWGREGAYNVALTKLIYPESAFTPKFLFYLLKSPAFQVYVVGFSRSAQAGFNKDDLGPFQIPLPPLNEQKRIVAKIEELFSELDKGIESLKKAREQLKVYRQAVLKHAFEGKLTENWRKENPETKALSTLIGDIHQGWSPKCDTNWQPKSGEWAIIKTTALQPLMYNDQEAKPLPSNLVPRPNIEVKAGDLLMTRKGPRNRTGVVCLVRETRAHSMLCDTVYRFRARSNAVLPEYLELALNSPTVQLELDRRKSGISDRGITLNHEKLKTLPVPYFENLDYQAFLVRTVHDKIERLAPLFALIDDQLQRAEALRQSILKRAFSGKLVPQDPDDEPASVLLERIKAEREKGEQSNGKQSVAKKKATGKKKVSKKR